MAVIVTHATTGKQYVLIGSGYSSYKEVFNGSTAGLFFQNTEEVRSQMLAVCDANGVIAWLPSHEVNVVSIDGLSAAELLKEKNDVYERSEKCPACGYPVTERQSTCPSCGLTLIIEEDEEYWE